MCIGLNKSTKWEVPEEVMRFGGPLRRIIWQVLLDDPWLGPIYLGKVDLADAYMRLCVRLDNTPSVAFIVPRKKPNDKQLVGFHLYLPMGYMDSTPLFCMSTEMITYMENLATGDRHHAPYYPLKKLADTQAPEEREPEPNDDEQWKNSPTKLRVHTLDQLDVYLDNFISTCQGGPKEGRQMPRHLFWRNKTVFQTNTAIDVLRKGPPWHVEMNDKRSC